MSADMIEVLDHVSREPFFSTDEHFNDFIEVVWIQVEHFDNPGESPEDRCEKPSKTSTDNHQKIKTLL